MSEKLKKQKPEELTKSQFKRLREQQRVIEAEQEMQELDLPNRKPTKSRSPKNR